MAIRRKSSTDSVWPSQIGWPSRDTLEQLKLETPQQSSKIAEEEQASSSFWREIAKKLPWWVTTPDSPITPSMVAVVEETQTTEEIEKFSGQKTHQAERLPYIPQLEKPEILANEKEKPQALSQPLPLPTASPSEQKLQSAVHSLFSDSPLETKEQLLARIALIKDNLTLILMVMNDQLKLEDKQGEISHEIIHKFQDMKKSLDKVLDKIKNDLERDQRIGSYFGYAQALISCGVLIGGALIFMFSNPALIPASVSLATTVSGIIATSGKAFFNIRTNQTDKKADDLQHQQNKHKKAMEISLEQYVSPALDSAVEIRSLMFRTAKTNDEVKSMIARK